MPPNMADGTPFLHSDPICDFYHLNMQVTAVLRPPHTVCQVIWQASNNPQGGTTRGIGLVLDGVWNAAGALQHQHNVKSIASCNMEHHIKVLLH